jgi:hypothetical protein
MEAHMRGARLGLALLGGLALSSLSLDAGRAAGFGYAPSFVRPLYKGRYAPISTVANPLVSAEYKATPDYNYLYTPSSAYASPPPIKSYRYAADHGYLLRPLSGLSAIAAAYRWRSCAEYVSPGRAAPGDPLGPGSGVVSRLDRPAGGRERGRKVDNSLKPLAMAPADQNASWRASTGLSNLGLGETVRLSRSGGARANDPCLLRP